MNHDSEIQPPPQKKVKIEHVTTKFDKEFEKCEIMKKWKPDIEKWLELYYKSTNVYEQGWLYSLHQRSVHLMYEEFAQVDDPRLSDQTSLLLRLVSSFLKGHLPPCKAPYPPPTPTPRCAATREATS